MLRTCKTSGLESIHIIKKSGGTLRESFLDEVIKTVGLDQYSLFSLEMKNGNVRQNFHSNIKLSYTWLSFRDSYWIKRLASGNPSGSKTQKFLLQILLWTLTKLKYTEHVYVRMG